ncbi:endonuclease/exonuclease/phosphatase family protein [Lacinutrix sp. MedPE-SW]|uniref:endonuclease/exonuclease/phosphatase family protein n=1 Tax=Lacinutrix sp. MedPE-SW TaxID=1860087 RepID=UPI00091EA0EF|nr:endonuclease/exonuclease/phosphatase family protein [Lacinutrix sp. MedPE-SW]OIQ23036.1 MAG: endonuclease [Lacinutrix sp. MedPE-SW]
MKRLRFFEKIIFFFNSVAAFALLLSYILPFLPPKTFAALSVLSLGVPFLILLNVVFFIYWLVKVKKQLLLSLLILIVGYMYFGSIYKFSESKTIENKDNLSIMNFNVRLFNLYKWIPEDNIENKLVEFVKKESPDILALQEYHPRETVDFSFYKYKYEKLSGKKVKLGQAIFSKYPIVNSGSIAFPNTANNAIFADVVKGNDTVRVYNIHLQSLRIDTRVEQLTTQDSEKLFDGVGQTFKMQQFQTELFLLHKRQCKYKMIVSGDFNNTALSYVYKEIKGDLVDTFKAAGNGFGRTYNFKFFPMRIDFILTHPDFKINSFKTYDVEYSDHYPIMTKVSF